MSVHKKVWVAAIAAAAVLMGLIAWQLVVHREHSAPSDCEIVRNLIAYNKSQGRAIAAAFNPEQEREASVNDYQQYADHLHADAARIRSADLGAHAHRLADDADKLVNLVKQVRSDTSMPADPSSPPFWSQPYAELSKQFHTELVALGSACPA